MIRRLALLALFALLAAPAGVQAQQGRGDNGHYPPMPPRNQSDFSGFVILGGGEWTPQRPPGDDPIPGRGDLDLDEYGRGWAERMEQWMQQLMCWLDPSSCPDDAGGGGAAPSVGGEVADATTPGSDHRTIFVRTPLPDAEPGSRRRRVMYVRVPAQPAYPGGPVVPGRVALESRLTDGDPRSPEEIVADMGGSVVYATGGQPSAEAGIAGDFEDLQAGPGGGTEAGIAGDFEDLQVPAMDRLLEALAGIVGDFEDLAIDDDELDVRALNSAGRSGEELGNAMVEILEDLLDQSDSLNPRQESRLADLLDIMAGITGDFEDLMGELDDLADAVARAR